MNRFSLLLSAASLLLFCSVANGMDLHVPSRYGSIQAAIDTATHGDTIIIAPGTYEERLTISKPLSLIGSGSASCTLHFSSGDDPVVLIRGARVIIRGMEINGGKMVSAANQYPGDSPVGLYAETSSKGIYALDATLDLEDIIVNNVCNYMITVTNSALQTRRLKLATRSKYYKYQVDIGIAINASKADITELTQTAGNVDHTIDINQPGREGAEWGLASVQIDHAHIRSSALSWGDCVRTYSNSSLTLKSSVCYRTGDGEPPKSDNHTGVAINGHDNRVHITDNSFIGVPWGVTIYGSRPGSNSVVVEKNLFEENQLGGVLLTGMSYQGVDLGGDKMGSTGRNRFVRTKGFDIRLGTGSTANILALSNTWSRQDPEVGIWDRADVPNLGKVKWREP